MRKLLGLLTAFTLCCSVVFAQQREITGTVVNQTDGSPAVGVLVSVKGTSTVAVTGADGKFTVSADANATLNFSALGLASQELPVAGRNNLVVTMGIESLEEVVVVGFGTQKKVNLTGSISSVDAKAFENRPITNVGQALVGLIPNLNIGISNGAPNTVPNISMRGEGSIELDTSDNKWKIKSKEPLILIDGVEVSATQVNQMNPNDIANVSVIRDASASAIYGTKAAFGVMLITTKSGSFSQESKINYSYDLSLDTPSALPDILNAEQLQQFVVDNYGWTSLSGTAPKLDLDKLEKIKAYMANPSDPANRYFMNGSSIVWTGNMNPYKEVVRKWTPTQKHNLSISGGSDKVTYYVSMGYLDQEGMYKIGKDDYTRYNISTRVNAKVNSWFNLETKVSYARDIYDAPYVPAYKGKIWSVLKQDADKNINMPIKTLASDPAGVQWTDNYLAYLDYGNREVSHRWNTVLSLSPEIVILKDVLKVRSDINYNPQGESSRRVDPSHYYLTFTWTPVSEQDEYKENRARVRKTNSENFATNTYVDFNKTFGKHSIQVIGGFNQEYHEWSSQITNLRKLLAPNIVSPGAVEDQTLVTAELDNTVVAARAVFGRISYNYAGKYLIEFNGRYDGSSKFMPHKRYVFFPTVALGYRISEEKFMDFSKGWLDNLKFRFSYGKLGSQPGNAYPYQAMMSAGVANYWLNGTWVNKVNSPNLASKNLSWEKVATTNFGIDATFLRGRLDLTFDAFKRVTSEILVMGLTSYPNTLGATPPLENSGEVAAKGFELSIKWRDKFANGLRYDVGFMLSDATTTVISYPSNSNNSLGENIFYRNQKVGEIWGYETGGILQKEDLVPDVANNRYIFYGPYHNSPLWPGDPWLRDLNGDGVINAGSSTADDPGDRRVIGNSTPRYRYAINLGASWKGFDFSMMMQGVAKRDFWPGGTTFWGGGTNHAGSKWMYDRAWRPDRTDAKYPRYRATAGAPAVQTGWLLNAAYLRMKQVVLGYTLPNALTSKWNIDKLRFSVSAFNLFEITEIPGVYDPDQLGDEYPQKRTISFGAQVTF
jgi:TonB-linked SusC/RagA family outer membrane protein